MAQVESLQGLPHGVAPSTARDAWGQARCFACPAFDGRKKSSPSGLLFRLAAWPPRNAADGSAHFFLLAHATYCLQLGDRLGQLRLRLGIVDIARLLFEQCLGLLAGAFGTGVIETVGAHRCVGQHGHTIRLNFDEALYATTPGWLREMCAAYRQAGVRPELEVFELGHIELAKQLIKEGLIDQPAIFQLCLGIKYGAPATAEAMMAMRNALPAGATWAAFGLGALQIPMAAQAVLMGGNVRVGLEDNLFLDKGVLATNAQLVTRAREVIERLGARVLSSAETRQKLGLASR